MSTQKYNKIVQYDMEKICRTCLKTSEMQSIYEKNKYSNEDLTIASMLMEFNVIQLTNEDELPNQVCIECTKEINKCYLFFKNCKISNEILRNRCKISKQGNQIKIFNEKNQDLYVENEVENNEAFNSSDSDSKTDKNEEIYYKVKSQNNRIGNQINLEQNCKSEFLESEKNSQDEYLFTQNIKQEIGDLHVEDRENNEVLAPIQFIDLNSLNSDNRTDENKEIYNNEESQDNGNVKETEDNESEIVDHQKDKQDEALLTEKTQSSISYKCKKCSLSFKTDEELFLHNQTTKHPKKPNKKKTCDVCQKSINCTKMSAHMRIHKQEKPHICELCSARFTLKSNLQRHIQATHKNERPFKCETCQSQFKQKIALQVHMRLHSGEKPYKCSHCTKCFTYSTALNLHTFNRHIKEKPDKKIKLSGSKYKCDICNKGFLTLEQLKKHQVYHGEKKFLCYVCGRRFINQTNLESHLIVHTGERPHTCEDCGKSFTQPSSLSVHKLIHTGAKPYSCTVCEKSFKQQGHLKYHMRTHSGEKPYSCSLCGKSFTLNGNLTIHMRTHTGETPFLCPTCGKGFYDSSSMKKHQRKHVENVTQ